MSAFDFLLADNDVLFFQDVAEARAGAPPRVLPPIEKMAQASAPVEKLARELEGDFVILYHAGPIGFGLGMTKRAMAHLEALARDPRVLASPGVIPDLFGKVAAQAIAIDLERASSDLLSELPEAKHAEARQAIAAIGTDLVKAAADEQKKLAGLFSSLGKGLGRAVGGAGRTVGAIRGAARGIGGAFARPLAEAAEGFRLGRAEGAAKRLADVEKKLTGARGAYEGATNAVARGFHGGRMRALEGERAGASARLGRAQDAQGGFHAPAAPAPAGKAVPSSLDEAPVKRRAPPSPRFGLPHEADAGKLRVPGSQASSTAKAPPPHASGPVTSAEEAKVQATAAAKSPESAPPASGERAHPPGVMDALKKLHHQGWGALDAREKQHVLTAGAAAIGAHRLMTGRDLLTGDKNE